MLIRYNPPPPDCSFSLYQVSELLPALEGPGGALCGYVEAHAFLASVKEAAEVAGEKAKAAEVRTGWGLEGRERGQRCGLGPELQRCIRTGSELKRDGGLTELRRSLADSVSGGGGGQGKAGGRR